MSRRTPFVALLRMVLMTLLVLGLCLQPAFAATCAIDDVRSTLGNDAGPVVSAVDADGAGSTDDGCSNPLCSDCCLHAAGSLLYSRTFVASVMTTPHASPRVEIFRPRDYPVDIRPPITH